MSFQREPNAFLYSETVTVNVFPSIYAQETCNKGSLCTQLWSFDAGSVYFSKLATEMSFSKRRTRQTLM